MLDFLHLLLRLSDCLLERELGNPRWIFICYEAILKSVDAWQFSWHCTAGKAATFEVLPTFHFLSTSWFAEYFSKWINFDLRTTIRLTYTLLRSVYFVNTSFGLRDN
jgi:hypothetical protein